MILILLTCMMTASLTGPVTVQLKSVHEDRFDAWKIRIDNKESFPFDSKGLASVARPDESHFFEIIDSKGKIRFLGTWSRLTEGSHLVLDVSAQALGLHEVVTGSRYVSNSWEVPGEIEVIDLDESDRQASQTSDWLKGEAEILIQKTNLGGGSPVMRGMSGARVLLVVDGFRLNNATYRQGLNQYLNTVPSTQLDQIEVASGPTGVQYGSDGLGGTIHLRTRDPLSVQEDALIYSGFFSSSDQTHTHSIDGSKKWEQFAVSGHFKLNKYQDLEAGDPVGDQIPTGYDAWDGSLNASYAINSDLRLKFINQFSSARHVPRSDRIFSGRDLLWEYHPQKQQLHGIRFEGQAHTALFDYLDTGFAMLIQDEGTRRISTGSPDFLSETRNKVETLQAQATMTKLTGQLQLSYGFDFQSDQVDSSGSETDLGSATRVQVSGKFPNDASYRSLGLFAIGSVRVGDQIVKGGVRQTWTQMEGTLEQPLGFVEQSNQRLTPSLSYSFRKDHYFLSAGISQGFRAPNLEDALSVGFSNRGFDVPNPDLEPEVVWNYELTARFNWTKTQLQGSVFTGRYEDLIERVASTYLGAPTYEGEPVFVLDNVGKAKTEGLSLSLRHQLSQSWQLNSEAAWTRGTQTDRDEPMTRIPPLRGHLKLTYHKGKLRLGSILDLARRQDRLSPGDIDDSRIPENGTPGYAVVHLRSSYAFTDRIQLSGSLENLTDKLYKTHGSGIYESGRRLVLELKAKF